MSETGFPMDLFPKGQLQSTVLLGRGSLLVERPDKALPATVIGPFDCPGHLIGE